MRKKEENSESLEERRIACREKFEKAVKENNLSLLLPLIDEYVECAAGTQSVLSLVREGFDCVSESCFVKEGANKPSSFKDWHFSYSIPVTIEVIAGLFLRAGKIFKEHPFPSTREGASAKSVLDQIYPLLDQVLTITDIGELALEAINLKKTMEVIESVRQERPNYYFNRLKGGEEEFIGNCLNFERNFLESARKTLATAKERAVEERDFGRLWVVAHKYFELGENYDRDNAWMTIDEGIKIARSELLNPEKVVEILLDSLWFFEISAGFEYSQKGDLTLFEEAKRLVEGALVLCSIEQLGQKEKERLAIARQSLYASSRVHVMQAYPAKQDRIVKGIEDILEELDEFTFGEQKGTKVLIQRKTTLLSRLTAKLTKHMEEKEAVRQTKPLKVGEILHFIDGSSAKILEVFIGGENVVYKVENEVGRVCATRIYHGEERGKDIGIERGRFVNGLRNQVSDEVKKCIPEVYDYKVSQDGGIYVVQEFIEGQNLEALPKPLPAEEIEVITCSLLENLIEIQQKEVAHLDIKPGNLILLPKNRKVAFIDWDLARKFGQISPKKATIEYAPPEVCLEMEVKGSADIYAIGVGLYELFTSETQTITLIGSRRMPLFGGTLEQRFPRIGELPDLFKDIVRDCTNLDPQKRPSAQEILQRLR